MRLVYAVPQHRNSALQGIAAMLSRVDSEHSLVRRILHRPALVAGWAVTERDMPVVLRGVAVVTKADVHWSPRLDLHGPASSEATLVSPAQVLVEGCRQLLSLVEQWTTIVHSQNAADTAGNGMAALKLDFARLEGLGFSLLGQLSPEVTACVALACAIGMHSVFCRSLNRYGYVCREI